MCISAQACTRMYKSVEVCTAMYKPVEVCTSLYWLMHTHTQFPHSALTQLPHCCDVTGSALAVLFTFWCLLLSLAAIAMVMLQGEFRTQDYHMVRSAANCIQCEMVTCKLGWPGQPVF